MIIIRKTSYIAAFLSLSLLLSQVAPVLNGILTSAGEPGGRLIIRHLSISPTGTMHELAVETIENITDIYYYSAESSPVASKLLKGGYSLANEKNRLIEADVASTDGRIDLEYTPSVQRVNVTYYRDDGGTETEMGRITDSAYIGDEYIPPLPIYENPDLMAELVGESKYVVGYGENDFKVSYRVAESLPEEASAEEIRGRGEGAGARLMSVRLNRDAGFVVGYPDSTFRPDDNLMKKDFVTILYKLASGYTGSGNPAPDEALSFLSERGIVPESGYNPNGLITWSEFHSWVSKLNFRLPQDERFADFDGEYWRSYFEGGRYVKRAEAVAIINELLSGDRRFRSTDPAFAAFAAQSDNPFTDVFEDYWAYNDIMRAAR